MDIFDKITDDFLGKKASLTQPLRLRRDYGEEEINKEARMTKEKFAERMENDPEFAEKWNANKKTKKQADESDIDRIASEFISERVAYAKGEEGRKQLEEKKKNDPEFAKKWDENIVHSKEEMDEKMGKKAGHHEHHRGSYMSVQHLAEMQDLIAGISEMVHRGEELPDWVESKIAHIHQTFLDLVGYFQYGEGYHTHEEDLY